MQVRGRGGAAFPFAIKLETILKGSRPVLVVNMSEGELASAKDHALALTRPHLVLDGVVATAKALRTRKVHVVLPGERPGAARAMKAAIAERNDGVNIYTSTASSRFVAGQARAVVELLSGRPNLPATTWAPEAIKGLNGRPTLLSNGETWARVGLLVLRGEEEYASIGTAEEPGGTLLTMNMPGSVPIVAEAAYGDRLRDYIPHDRHGLPAMVGGFHGAWATWETLASAKVSVNKMRAMGNALGAGLVLLVAGLPGVPHHPDRRVPRRPERRSLRPLLQRAPGAGHGTDRRPRRSRRPGARRAAVEPGRPTGRLRPPGRHGPPGQLDALDLPGRGGGPRPRPLRPEGRQPRAGRRQLHPDPRGGVMAQVLRVDWPSCEARGLCHEVLPELVDLDEWGYPIVKGPLTKELMDHAKEAVKVCPRLALRIVEGR